MILVAGGTGRLGSELVRRLTAQGERVRVLTRNPAREANLRGAEVVVGDVRHPGDLGAAVQDVAAVVSAITGFIGEGHVTPASIDRDGNGNLIGAAATVGAHYILVSVIGASPTHPLELFRMKAAAERQLQQSELPWTIVRAGAFVELYQDLMRRTAARSTRPLVFGHGDNPIQFASISQVVTILQNALTDPSTRGTVIEVDGPSMTFNQLAASLAPELGTGACRPRHIPRALLHCLAVPRSTAPGRLANAALIMDSHDLKTGKLAR